MLQVTVLQVIGAIPKPSALANFNPVLGGGVGQLINLFIYILIEGAGIFALFNLILDGYAFLSAGDDPKKVAGAWAKIWQSILGLAVAAGSIILAAIFGLLIFGDANALLKPIIPGI